MRIWSNFSWFTISTHWCNNDIKLITSAIWMKFHFNFYYKQFFLLLKMWVSIIKKFHLVLLIYDSVFIFFLLILYECTIYMVSIIWFHLKLELRCLSPLIIKKIIFNLEHSKYSRFNNNIFHPVFKICKFFIFQLNSRFLSHVTEHYINVM